MSIKRSCSFVVGYVVLFVVCALFPKYTYALGPIIRSGESVAIDSSQVLEGDFYGFGESVTLSGEAKKDVYILGMNATVNAPVAQDLVVVGGTVQVHGTVTDDVRILGGEVVLATPVNGDVVVFGGTLKILSTAEIKGDLIFYGGEIEILGPVLGSIYGRGANIRIDSQVSGDVTVRGVDTLTLGDGAEIGGAVIYQSSSDLVRAQNALVVGDITKEQITVTETPLTVQDMVLAVLVVLFSTLALFFLARAKLEEITQRTWVSFGRCGLVGLGVFFGLPFVSTVLLTSVIGAFLGLTFLFLYFFLLVLSMLMVPAVLGNALMHFMKKYERLSLTTILVGVLTFSIVIVIPYLGMLLLFAVFLATFGALAMLCYEHLRS